jgi:hypothetical protein
MQMSGDKVLALRESSDHISPMALVSLDPKTGEETPYFYFNLPTEAESFTITDGNDVLVEDGRLFFGAKQANGPGGKDGKAWIWLALGIESAAAKTAVGGQ